MACNLISNGCIKVVGPSKEHLKMEVVPENTQGITFPAIAFNQAEHYKLLCHGISFDACFTLEENNFRGKKTWQMNIKDIKTREDIGRINKSVLLT
jgi:single-stranded-DNA-specific exonuclease